MKITDLEQLAKDNKLKLQIVAMGKIGLKKRFYRYAIVGDIDMYKITVPDFKNLEKLGAVIINPLI